jgi:Ser/Thr protein kinase RdoA (MazF antagonist)
VECETKGGTAVARLGKRSAADLNWETQLLIFLKANGLEVPLPIPTMSGELFAGGVVVMTFIEGDPPEGRADWQRVAATVKKLHMLTQNWPQRPGWKGSIELLTEEKGTKIDLSAMSSEGVKRCRAAWSRLADRTKAVVHGDLNARNIRVKKERIALIDWDEAHVDVPELDLVLPYNASDLDAPLLDIATQASAAWQAAVCWDDDYSKEKLASVRDS